MRIGFLTDASVEQLEWAKQEGFGSISWHAMRVSDEWFQTSGRAYWQDYLNNPQIVVLEA